MSARATLAVLVLAMQFVLPMVASAAIVQKWQTAPGVTYQLLGSLGDFNGDGIYDLLTGESPSGGTYKIGIRSGATGALLAQTALAYHVMNLWFADLDNDYIPEMIVWDVNGNLSCFNTTVGSGTLTQRWSVTPFAGNQLAQLAAVDLDGNGHRYLAINPASSNNEFYIYTGTGYLVTHVTLPAGGSGYHLSFYPFDYDQDNLEELLVDVWSHPSGGYTDVGPGVQDQVFMFERNGLTGVDGGVTGSPEVALGPSTPNPAWTLSRVEYSLPAAGPAYLRLFDVSGRQVRTLVAGQVGAGRHEAVWDGRDANGQKVPAGAYFYELNANGKRATRRVVQLQ